MGPSIDFEDLDPEALEDIEVSLYGMLHHAYGEDDHQSHIPPVMAAGSPNSSSSTSPKAQESVIQISLDKKSVQKSVSHFLYGFYVYFWHYIYNYILCVWL